MTYEVRILPAAVADRRHVFHYIEERSPEGAIRWEAAYERLLDRLERRPQAFGLAPESEHFSFDLRQAFFRTPHGLTYRLVFRVDGSTVTIFRVRGPGQRPLDADNLT